MLRAGPGLPTLLGTTRAHLAPNASKPAATKTSPPSWEGRARSKPPLPSHGSSSGARDTYLRQMPSQQNPPSARASAFKKPATLMEGALSGRCSSRFPSESLLLHQGNTQKTPYSAFPRGQDEGSEGKDRRSSGLTVTGTETITFSPYIKSYILVTGIKPEMQNKFGHPTADKKQAEKPTRAQSVVQLAFRLKTFRTGYYSPRLLMVKSIIIFFLNLNYRFTMFVW